MRVGDVMSPAVKTIAPDAAAEDAWRLMRAERIHHLVVNEGGTIVGVISNRDLGGTEAGTSGRAGRRVSAVMTAQTVTATPRTTLREAANLMRGRGIGCLPIVDGKRLVGILTVTDLLDLIGRGAERPVEQAKRWTLKHRGPRRQRTRRVR